MRIVVLDGYTLNPGDLSWDGFRALGGLTVYDRTPPERIAERIGGAEIVITNKTPLSGDTFDACPSIRYVGVLATGYNVVDTDAARGKGITVTNVPEYGTRAVAQYVFALLLEICHHAGAHGQSVRDGEWARRRDFSFWDYPLVELAGKTMGIVGLGRIGRAAARIAQAFGMRVLACDDIRDPALESDSLRYCSLNELLEGSDVVSLHCPLRPSTRGMISRAAIGRMKDGAILINTARGQLVVEEDLREALDSGKIAWAALDVVSEEPIRADNPLLGARNCLVTPHIAWAPRESRARLMEAAAGNLKSFLEGRPRNVVNG